MRRPSGQNSTNETFFTGLVVPPFLIVSFLIRVLEWPDVITLKANQLKVLALH